MPQPQPNLSAQRIESAEIGKPLLPNNAFGFITFYNLMYQARGITVAPHLIPIAMALTDERIRQLLVIMGPGAGKSLLMSVAYTAFALGHDPSLTVLGLSAGEGLPQGFMLALMELVDHNPFWKKIFPGVEPDKEKGWSTERGLFLTGHPSGDPDSSYFAAGTASKALTGKHGRLINADDLHDEQNSSSAEACLRVRDIYYRQLVGRADPRGARFIFAGRRWHEEDVYGHLKSTGKWVVMELPALRGGFDNPYNGPLFWDIFIPAGLTCCFNDPEFEQGTFGKDLWRSLQP